MVEKCDIGSLAGLSLCRPGLHCRPGHVGFMVDKVAQGQVFLSEYFHSFLSGSFHQWSMLVFHLARNLYDFNSWTHCWIKYFSVRIVYGQPYLPHQQKKISAMNQKMLWNLLPLLTIIPVCIVCSKMVRWPPTAMWVERYWNEWRSFSPTYQIWSLLLLSWVRSCGTSSF
jgi:hypothetical protein